MIRNASFRNFRGFGRLELSDLRNITIISGKNNSGKSSTLEGIFLALDYRAPDSFAVLNQIRGISYNMRPEDMWDTLFHNLSLSEDINIRLDFDDRALNISYSRDDSFINSVAMSGNNIILKQFISSSPQSYSLKFSCSYGDSSEGGHFIMNLQGIQQYSEQGQNLQQLIPMVQYIPSSRVHSNNAVVELFGIVTRRNMKDKLIHYLQLIDPSISDLTTITSGTQSQLYANVLGRWLPLRLAGDGFDHLLIIIASMIAHPDSILLVDEIETGFHYSVYPKLWEAVMFTAKEERCQVIAATHSYECLESAAAQADTANLHNDFCYFRLGRDNNGEVNAYRFSQEILAHATDNDLEVR